MSFSVRNLTYCYSSKFALKQINLDFEPVITALIGPNGAGKSTLIKCISGMLKYNGELFYDDQKISDENQVNFSKIMSYLPQSSCSEAAITVFETVLLGLMDSLSYRVSAETVRQVAYILELFGIENLAQRRLYEISGGQRQLALLAQAIIKEPEVLIMDESLNSLDIHRQFEMMNLIQRLSVENHLTTIIAMHDLNLAARYAGCIVVINNGEVYSYGKPKAVLTPDMIREVYRVKAEVTAANDSCIPVIDLVDIA